MYQPGTGTPGYWKSHPEAWPVSSITVGGVTYTYWEALDILKNVGRAGKDKAVTMFSSLVPAMLNTMIGNDSSCLATTIDARRRSRQLRISPGCIERRRAQLD